jgi:hypothetical protein
MERALLATIQLRGKPMTFGDIHSMLLRSHGFHALALAWQSLGPSACHDQAHKTYAANRDSLSSDSELLLLPCL